MHRAGWGSVVALWPSSVAKSTTALEKLAAWEARARDRQPLCFLSPPVNVVSREAGGRLRGSRPLGADFEGQASSGPWFALVCFCWFQEAGGDGWPGGQWSFTWATCHRVLAPHGEASVCT